MNNKGQFMNSMITMVIALAVIVTGIYITYYGIIHYHDMQCSLLGMSGGITCVFSIILIGIIFVIIGIVQIYYILFHGGGQSPVMPI